MNKVMKAIKSKKDSFRWGKTSPSGVNKKEHKLWQIKCNSVMRQAKRDYEKHIAKSIKTNKKKVFKYINSKKTHQEDSRALRFI